MVYEKWRATDGSTEKVSHLKIFGVGVFQGIGSNEVGGSILQKLFPSSFFKSSRPL